MSINTDYERWLLNYVEWANREPRRPSRNNAATRAETAALSPGRGRGPFDDPSKVVAQPHQPPSTNAPTDGRATFDPFTGDVVTLENHSKVVAIGDVHGDMLPMLQTLSDAKLIEVDEGIMRLAAVCHTSDDPAQRTRLALSDDQLNTITWIGGNAVAIFLGDVLDNRRPSACTDKWGCCGVTGTQSQMMRLLWSLNEQAKRHGGRVVWVLGNHCVENTMSDSPGFCASYAPVKHSYSKEGEIAMVTYDTCTGWGFSDEHIKRVRHWMKRCDCVVMLKIVHHNHVIGAFHGGVTKETAGLLKSKFVDEKYRLVDPRGGDNDEKTRVWGDNLRKINLLFRDATLEGEEVAREITQDRQWIQVMPTWCRPRSLDREPLYNLFGINAAVVGHQVQQGIRCVDGAGIMMKKTGLVENGQLCFTDIGMSRAFDDPNGDTKNKIANVGYIVFQANGKRIEYSINETSRRKDEQ